MLARGHSLAVSNLRDFMLLSCCPPDHAAGSCIALFPGRWLSIRSPSRSACDWPWLMQSKMIWRNASRRSAAHVAAGVYRQPLGLPRPAIHGHAYASVRYGLTAETSCGVHMLVQCPYDGYVPSTCHEQSTIDAPLPSQTPHFQPHCRKGRATQEARHCKIRLVRLFAGKSLFKTEFQLGLNSRLVARLTKSLRIQYNQAVACPRQRRAANVCSLTGLGDEGLPQLAVIEESLADCRSILKCCSCWCNTLATIQYAGATPSARSARCPHMQDGKILHTTYEY